MKPRQSVISDFIGHWRPEPKEPPGLKGTSSWWCTRGCERCIPAFQQRYWVLPRDWSSDWAAPTLSGQEMVSMHRPHPNCLPSPGISSNSQCPHWKHRMMLFGLIQQSLVICSCLLVRLVRKEDWVHHEALHHSRKKEGSVVLPGILLGILEPELSESNGIHWANIFYFFNFQLFF